MSDNPTELKTTRDLLRKVEEDRAAEPPSEKSTAANPASNSTSTPSSSSPTTTQPATDTPATEPLKVRSFASYMSSIKQQKSELAEQKRKEAELEGQKQRDTTESQEEVRLKLEGEQKKDEELLRLSDKTGSSHTPGQSEPQPQEAKPEESQPQSEAHESPKPSTPIDAAPNHSQLATHSKPEPSDVLDREDIVSTPRLHSTLSSELSQIPSSVERKVEYPPTIPEGDKTLDQTPTKKNNEDSTMVADEDSDADTVYGDSPPKKRGRLVRKSELDSSSKPVKKVDFDESDDDDDNDDHDEDDDDDDEDIENDTDNDKHGSDRSAPHRKKKSYGKLQRSASSRSSSPGRHRSKKQKGGRDHSGRRLLQRVCEKGQYEQAKSLIADGADVNDKDYAGNTALHEAALSGYSDIVELLLKNGAKVDIQNGEEDLDTPLIDAAANGHIDTVKILLEYGADPRIENAGGQNALDSLEESHASNEIIEKMLREATLKLTKQGKRHDISGHTSDAEDRSRSRSRPRQQGGRRVASRTDLLWMDFTSKHGLEEVYRRSSEGDLEFVGHYLQNVQKPDAEALALAAKFGHTDVVNLFLAFGAKADLPNEHGQTALMRTVGRGHMATVKLLLDAGADVSKKSDDGKNAVDYALSSLMVNDEEVDMLKSYVSGKVSQRDHHKPSKSESSSDLKREQLKKRKLSVKEDDKSPEVKKKKVAKVTTPTDYKPAGPKPAKVMERKLSGASINQGPSKSEPKRVTSGPKLDVKHIAKEPEPSVVPPPPESEEQKQARLLKEAEDEKRRQQYEAERLAKRKAREQEFLSNFETEEKKKEEELRKLSQLENQRKLEEAKAHHDKLIQQQKIKEEEMKTEEVERRMKMREVYPTGLRLASFGKNPRSKEDALSYLPLYKVSIGGVFFVADLQVVLSLGIEDFVKRYQDELYTGAQLLSKDEKSKMFRFMSPVLVKRGIQSVSKRLENYNEEMSNFLRLKLTWIKYDTLLEIIHRDFSELSPLFSARAVEVDIGNDGDVPKFTKPSEVQSQPVKRSASDIVNMKKKLPLYLRVRPAVVKALARNKKMW